MSYLQLDPVESAGDDCDSTTVNEKLTIATKATKADAYAAKKCTFVSVSEEYQSRLKEAVTPFTSDAVDAAERGMLSKC